MKRLPIVTKTKFRSEAILNEAETTSLRFFGKKVLPSLTVLDYWTANGLRRIIEGIEEVKE